MMDRSSNAEAALAAALEKHQLRQVRQQQERAAADEYMEHWRSAADESQKEQPDACVFRRLAAAIGHRWGSDALDKLAAEYDADAAAIAPLASQSHPYLIRLAEVTTKLHFTTALVESQREQSDEAKISSLVCKAHDARPWVDSFLEDVRQDLQCERKADIAARRAAAEKQAADAEQSPIRERMAPGDIDAKLSGWLIHHHGYEDGTVVNHDPAEQKQIAIATDIPPSTINKRFATWFDGQDGYEALCESKKLGWRMKSLLGEWASPISSSRPD